MVLAKAEEETVELATSGVEIFDELWTAAYHGAELELEISKLVVELELTEVVELKDSEVVNNEEVFRDADDDKGSLEVPATNEETKEDVVEELGITEEEFDTMLENGNREVVGKSSDVVVKITG